MTYNSDIHHRRTIRLQGYDYSSAGMYFVTLCTKERQCLFGRIDNEEMNLNDAGKIVYKCWSDIPLHFPHAALDKFIVMPNHVHGIIVLKTNAPVGANNYSPLHEPSPPHSSSRGTSKTIGSIVRGFKIGVTKWMRTNTAVDEVWQRNYWERVIRNEEELNGIREYIQANPGQWENDKLYFPATTPMSDAVGANNYSPLLHGESP